MRPRRLSGNRSARKGETIVGKLASPRATRECSLRVTAGFSLALQSGDGVRSNRFPAADGVHAFVGLGLEIDLFGLDAQGVGQRLAHGRKIREQFGFFNDDHGIDVANRKAAVDKKFAGMLEKMKAGNTLPFRVGVREMRPDVAEASGTAERIGNSMG